MSEPVLGFRAPVNERFKRRAAAAWPLALVVAVLFEFALFSSLPRLDGGRRASPTVALSAIAIAPAVELPPPPEQIARPVPPPIAAVEVREEVAIAPTVVEWDPIQSVGPPPAPRVEEEDRPPFVPYTVPPRLTDRKATLAFLARSFPVALRNAGIGGIAQLWIRIDETGAVVQSQVAESSGYPGLDIALRVLAGKMEFSRAMPPGRIARAVAIPVQLRAGWNRVLLEVSNRGGSWVFQLRSAGTRSEPPQARGSGAR